MAVPKRKSSKARRDKRRAANIQMSSPNIIKCPQCHEPKLPHRVCKKCGFYHDKEVVKVQ